MGRVAVANELDEKVWNWRASEMRSLTVKVLSTVTPWTTDPTKALRVRGLYLVSAWLITAFRKAFWRWMRPKSLVPSYCQ